MLAFATPCEVLVDVGTDHGRVPLAALSRGLARRAVGIDRAEGPLAVAERHRALAGLGDRLALRCGWGLRPLEAGEGDALTIAGMGGKLAARILAEGPLAGFSRVVVQPNQEAAHVRRWAEPAGWHLADEAMVEEQGRFYPVLAFVPGTGPDPAYAVAGFTRSELEVVGPRLLAARDAVTARHARAQAERLSRLAAPEADMWRRALAALEGRDLPCPSRERDGQSYPQEPTETTASPFSTWPQALGEAGAQRLEEVIQSGSLNEKERD